MKQKEKKISFAEVSQFAWTKRKVVVIGVGWMGWLTRTTFDDHTTRMIKEEITEIIAFGIESGLFA